MCNLTLHTFFTGAVDVIWFKVHSHKDTKTS